MRTLSVAALSNRVQTATLVGLPIILCAAMSGLTGCGMGLDQSSTLTVNEASFHGTVHGGQQPVTQSNIALFASSSSGYGSTVTPLANTTSDTAGSFAITTSYTCPTGQQMYLVAAGGNPGLASGTDNSAIFLVAALGPCPVSSAVVDINEVTTVAAAFALSGFVPAGGAGMTEAKVAAKGAMAGIATSSTNTQGLSDAFLNANNIVNYTTGLAYTATPTAGSTGAVPQSIIHALADILQTCVNATTPAGGNCPTLFTDTTPPVTSPTVPVNVFQAALNIAQYPDNNVSGLYGLISTSPAFAYTLAAAPSDWTIGVAYTNAALVSGSGLGISSNDTVYVGGTGYLIDFTPQGAPISTTNLLTGVPSGDALRYIAFDSTGDLFVADGNAAATDTKVYELTTTGTVNVLNYGAVATDANTYNIAVDGLGDVWTPTYSKATCASVGCSLIEFAKGTSSYSPFNTFSTFTAPQPTGAYGGARGLAFDVNTGNVWITAIDDNLAELFKVTPVAGGAAATAAAGPIQLTGLGTEVAAPSTKTGCGTISVAVDKNASAWFVTAGGTSTTCGATTSAALTSVPSNTTGATSGYTSVNVSSAGLNGPTQVIIDGNNNVFIANTGASSVAEYNTTIGAFESGAAGFLPTEVDTAHSIYQPSYLEADRSGALWVLSSGNGSTHSAALVQILGVAAPTNPVQSAGQYGVKP